MRAKLRYLWRGPTMVRMGDGWVLWLPMPYKRAKRKFARSLKRQKFMKGYRLEDGAEVSIWMNPGQIIYMVES